MTVDYKLEREDLLAFMDERRRFGARSLSRIYYYGILPVLGVGLAIASGSFPTAIVFTVLFIASGLFIQNYAERQYRRKVYSEENISLNTRLWHTTLTEEGIRNSTDAVESLYRWPFIHDVFRGSRYIYIVLSPIYQLHIPVRAFADEEHLQKFVSTARSYIKTQAGSV